MAMHRPGIRRETGDQLGGQNLANDVSEVGEIGGAIRASTPIHPKTTILDPRLHL